MAGHTTVKVTLKVCPIRSEKSTPRARVSTDRTPTLSSLRTKHAETTAKDSVYTTLPYNNVFPGFGKHRCKRSSNRTMITRITLHNYRHVGYLRTLLHPPLSKGKGT